MEPLPEDRRHAVATLNMAAYALPLAALVGAGTQHSLAALGVALAAAAIVYTIMRLSRYQTAVLRGLAYGGGLWALLTGFLSLEREQGPFVLYLAVFAGSVLAVLLTETAQEKAQALDEKDFDDEEHSISRRDDPYADPVMWHHRNVTRGRYDPDRR